MPTITKKNAHNLPDPGFGGVAYGNIMTLKFKFETNASGVFVDSDTDTAVQAADVVVLGVIPAGTRLMDMIAVCSDAFTATSTFDLGFQYKDGVDSALVPQDADYFGAAVAYNATGVFRKETVTPPVSLPKDAYLILTNNTAAQAAAGVIDIEIIGQIGGPE